MLGGLNFWRTEQCLAPIGIQTPYLPARSQFTVLYKLRIMSETQNVWIISK